VSMHNPPHPGLVLREYLRDLAVTAAAVHLRRTRVTLSRALSGKAGIRKRLVRPVPIRPACFQGNQPSEAIACLASC
jgi:hypothetical protein